jgi:hypothetical protein
MAASHDFIKNFVKFSINSKRIHLKNLIMSELSDDINNNKVNKKPNTRDQSININITNSQLHHTNDNFKASKVFILNIQFIVECIFISILDSSGKKKLLFLFP